MPGATQREMRHHRCGIMVRTSPVFTPVLVTDVLILDEELYRGKKILALVSHGLRVIPPRRGSHSLGQNIQT